MINKKAGHLHHKYCLLFPFYSEPVQSAEDDTERAEFDKCSMIERSNDFISIIDTNAQFEYLNPAFLKFTGYNPEDLLGKSITMFYSNFSNNEKVIELWENINNGQSYSGVVLCKKRSGELFYNENIINPVINSLGVVNGYMSMGRDVTSRIIFEQENKMQEERFRLIVENISDIIFLLTGDGNIEYVSPTVSSLSYLPVELAGKEFVSLMEPKYRDEITGIFYQAASKKSMSFSFEICIADKNGIKNTFAASGKIFSEKDGINKFIIICRNINKQKQLLEELEQYKGNLEKLVEERTSELLSTNEKLSNEAAWRKEAEDELSVKDERLALALEVSAYGLWDINLESGSIYYNERFSDILNIPIDNKHVIDLKNFESFIHPDDLFLFKDKFRNHLSGKSDFFEMELRILINNDVMKYVSLRGKVVSRDSDGNPMRFIGRMEDITLRRSVEDKLQKALEREKELNELKSRFISIVSHEYRTPLSTILSSAEILELYEGQLNAQQKQDLYKKIETCVDEMIELLDDVITMSKYDLEKANYAISVFDIISFSKSIIHDISAGFKITPAIHFSSVLNEFEINSSPILYKQILTNLVTNAIKYTPVTKNIYIIIRKNVPFFSLEVKDEGIGIPDEDQKLLFEPFSRGKNVGSISGSGLGLPIVKRSVDSLQGKLTFESYLNLGTTFQIELPIDYNL